MTPERTRAARDLLAFYLGAGVDASIGDAPVNRLGPDATEPPPAVAEGRHPPSAAENSGRFEAAAPQAPPRPSRETASAIARAPLRTDGASPQLFAGGAPPPAAPEAAVMAARDAARNATSLEELAAIVSHFEGCPLKATASRLVFADGNPQAAVMFVGEAPGADEDREGLPFVGRSGRLLDRMMAAISLDRQSAYIANIIPWRPPGNRTPTPLESQTCLPFSLRQIELADPDILVCLGAPAAQALIGVKEGIMKTRGRWFSFHTGTREIRAIATLHPAYLLRQPLAKRLAWRDFLAIRAALAQPDA
jgi:uracil-DNA glycosylase family 4